MTYHLAMRNVSQAPCLMDWQAIDIITLIAVMMVNRKLTSTASQPGSQAMAPAARLAHRASGHDPATGPPHAIASERPPPSPKSGSPTSWVWACASFGILGISQKIENCCSLLGCGGEG